MVPMDTAWPPSGAGAYQTQGPRTGNIISRRESVEEQRENMRKILVKRNIPTDLWEYYLEIPENWNHEDINEKGLHNGIKAILLAPRTVTPYWVENASMDKFVSLKMKLTGSGQLS